MTEIRKLINLTLQIIYDEFGCWASSGRLRQVTAKVLVGEKGEKLDTWAPKISYVSSIGNPLLNGDV